MGIIRTSLNGTIIYSCLLRSWLPSLIFHMRDREALRSVPPTSLQSRYSTWKMQSSKFGIYRSMDDLESRFDVRLFVPDLEVCSSGTNFPVHPLFYLISYSVRCRPRTPRPRSPRSSTCPPHFAYSHSIAGVSSSSANTVTPASHKSAANSQPLTLHLRLSGYKNAGRRKTTSRSAKAPNTSSHTASSTGLEFLEVD